MDTFIGIDAIKLLAKEEGFVDVGATKAEQININAYKNWLKDGHNATMYYLNNYLEQRANPVLLMEGAKTIFCFLYSYNDNRIDEETLFHISHYAQRRDYHYVVKTKLNNIISKLHDKNPNFIGRAFVDSAPIMEVDLAVRAGLGWKGRNSLLVTKKYGNKVFIGEIIANVESNYGKQMQNLCGECHRCINVCPNNAIMDSRQIDARHCISYQTIENKGIIDKDVHLNGYIYGCDICLESCIWNKKAVKQSEQDVDVKFMIKDLLIKAENGNMTKEDFQKIKKLSPMNRIKYEKFLSNIDFARADLQNQSKIL